MYAWGVYHVNAMRTDSSGCVLGCYVNNMLLRNGNCY